MTRKILPPEEWNRVKALFDEALLVVPPARTSFVESRVADPALREEVLALLAAHDGAGGFLDGESSSGLTPGQRLGPYEIRGLVGGGGMGDVYRAHDARLGRDVALKVLRDSLVGDEMRARFRSEARAIAALSHLNVLAIYDVGEADGIPYLITELLEGETLRQRLRRGVPPIDVALAWAVEIALGLAAAHDAGLVHRDLKPENVFLVRDGGLKILDFGLARALPGSQRSPDGGPSTLPGLVVGTLGYLAPEQARCEPAVAASDLFALGAILFELLTGQRAFKRDTAPESLRAVLEHEPPAPTTLRRELPRWLDAVVARCLAKNPRQRFQSARDLAFVLTSTRPAEPPPRRRGRAVLAAALLAIAAAGAAFALGARGRGRTAEPPRLVPLTSSGKDRDPAVSPDGRLLAFVSDRDGRARIWLKQLDGGSETAVTDGPDDAPRFSPDGGQILFTRAGDDGATSLYRVHVVGKDARKIIADASNGDWSPDGARVTFVRWRDRARGAQAALMTGSVDGSNLRELAQLANRQLRPRWSPDGRFIAVTGLAQLPGAPQAVLLVPSEGGPPRTLPTPGRIGLTSAVAWDGPGALLYSEALSVTGNSSGSAARIVRQQIADGAARTLAYTMENSLVLDRWPGRGAVFDTRSSRQNLRDVTLDGRGERYLSRGTSADRQPVVTPDGAHVIFTSGRGASLDVWKVARRDGAVDRLTDHPADDWDPSLSADGKTLLFSSNRSGNFEVWMADIDGAHARQVTHDGVDAENPSLTRDGAWVVYASGAAGRAGIWRVRPDGSDARLLVPDAILPDVSPDGQRVLFQWSRSPRLTVIGVAAIAEGTVLPFEIHIDVKSPPPPTLGRGRWTPDGQAIAFLGRDDEERTGVYLQPVVPGEDTRAQRRPLAGFDPDRVVESFALTPDGERLILAEWEQRSTIVAAVGLRGD